MSGVDNIRFPWGSIEKGKSFFVPSLTPAKTKLAGERAAIAARCKCRAAIGIYKGMLGVMFTLTHRYKTADPTAPPSA